MLSVYFFLFQTFYCELSATVKNICMSGGYGCNILGVPFYLARYNVAACVYVWVYEYGCTIVLLHGCITGTAERENRRQQCLLHLQEMVLTG